jgi:hypothetical protein
LFWLIALVAMGLGWWVHRQQFVATIEAQQNLIFRLAHDETTAQAQLELLRTSLRNQGRRIKSGRKARICGRLWQGRVAKCLAGMPTAMATDKEKLAWMPQPGRMQLRLSTD